ncbi:MAG TPA: sugar transferase [Solirubrobacteraceae bacterium]|jgi:exopolysaccharide biosynthesis polyprenyl glycosylphosphotransferase|nr:sugar transferase [Solirubrobacteraceae bacterium]
MSAISTERAFAAPGPVSTEGHTEIRRSRRDYRLRRIIVAADTLALCVGMLSWTAITAAATHHHLLWGLMTVPLWLVMFNLYGLYDSGLRSVGHSTADDIPAMGHAYLLGAVVMWMYFQLTPAGKLGFGNLLAFVAVAFTVMLALRFAIRHLTSSVLGAERVLLVGSGPLMPLLARQMERSPAHGLLPAAVLTRPENERWPLPLPSLGDLRDVDAARVLREQKIDRVVISAEGIEDEQLLELVCLCRNLGVRISALPSLAAMMGPSATIDHLEGITLIGMNQPSLARSSRALKRAMDLVGASLLLLFTVPIWVPTAIAIKLDSPGPVLFWQERVGRGGTPFRVAKFRSMVRNAEELREYLLAESRQKLWLDLEHDPRITRVGRFLRLTSLDELPQLLNVLRGEMSLVGPRPLIVEEDRNVSGWARGRLDLTPGITGVWQVLGRARIPFEQMIMIDYLYVANWSLWTDVKLILRTLPAVLTRRGAN